jgi:cytochrome c551/c552
MKKWLKIVFIAIVAFLVVAQFFRPSHVNPPIDPAKTLAANAPVPANIQQIFDRSCKDCHSNGTVYPWYSNVAPVSWLLADDIKDGRREVNFSEWGNYTPKRRLRKLKEICDQVKEGDMPLKKYIPLHPEAKLSDADRAAICAWAEAEARREGAAK